MFTDRILTVLDGTNREQMTHFYRDIMRYPQRRGADPAAQSPAGDTIFDAGKTGGLRISASPLPYGVGPTAMWIEASYVDDVYNEIVKTGELDYCVPPKDTYYHARPSYVGDPNGNTTCVINYEKDLPARREAGLKNGWYAEEYRSVFYLKNIGLCREFYTEILGLKQIYDWKENLGDRGFKFELCPGSHSYLEILFREPFVRLRLGMAELFAENLDTCFSGLSKRPGVTILSPPAGTGADRHFSLADPDGNIIRIYQAG
jgi:catechol 2,3-dioxygenase-like lactoylglutathione lyase family enzyme